MCAHNVMKYHLTGFVVFVLILPILKLWFAVSKSLLPVRRLAEKYPHTSSSHVSWR